MPEDGIVTAPTLGGEGYLTLGEPRPATFGTDGPEADPIDDDVARLEDRYAITLFRGDDRLAIEHVFDVSAVREHTALSDWTAVVDADEALEGFVFGEAVITYDQRIVYTGTLEVVDIDESEGEATIEGRGPGRSLASGSVAVTFRGIEYWRAIRRFWDEFTDFDASVTPPDDRRSIDSLDLEGTPIDILQELHEKAGMRFVIDNRRRLDEKRAMSFGRGDVVRQATWTEVSAQRSRDVTDYHNAVHVRGARRPDDPTDRFDAFVEDADEVEAVGERITWLEVDPSLESDAECETLAEALLDEFVAEDAISGSIDTFPRLIDPGPSYTIDRWDDRRVVGPYSLDVQTDFEAEGLEPASIPAHGQRDSGTLTFWLRPPGFFPTEEDGGRIIDGEPIGVDFDAENSRITARFTTDEVDTILDISVIVSEFPSEALRQPWGNLWLRWSYDPGADETHVTAGAGGTEMDAEVVPGRPAEPTAMTVGGDAAGFIDDLRIYRRAIDLEVLERLALGKASSDVDLVRRYPFNEGNHSNGTVYDVASGEHGALNDAEHGGRPLPLERVGMSEAAGLASSTLEFERTESIMADIQRLRSATESLKRNL